VVLDGMSRDSWGILDMKFPVFATGLSPADSKGRLEVIAIRGTIPVGGVSVADGDLVVADDDGCVVVPAAVEDEVVRLALEKVSGEDKMREILRKGASIKEVFAEHGIL
jgi:regulator of RNase E activity RraA